MPLPPSLAENRALTQLWAALPTARAVGGAVRDAVANYPISDVDLAVPLPPDIVIQQLTAKGIRTIPTGIRHGTITALIHDSHFEITSLRQDVETNGRHAVIALTDDWHLDAKRRDFTINAMSMDRNGRVFDYFGGLDDLAAGTIRFVGDAEQRIREDFLRILRYFRFFARYGREKPDPAALRAIAANLDGIQGLSAERVWSEIKRILAASDPSRAVELMVRTNVLHRLLPECRTPDKFARAIARGMPPDPLARFMALIDCPAEPIADRLHLSDKERKYCAAIRHAPDLPADATDAELRVALADHDRVALVAKTYLAEDDDDRTRLRARLARASQPVFPLKGRDALALGAGPGPIIGAALAAVRVWWLAHGCLPDIDACREHLKAELSRLDPTK